MILGIIGLSYGFLSAPSNLEEAQAMISDSHHEGHSEKVANQGDNSGASYHNEKESLSGSRGGKRDSGLRIHSIRLPGIVAQQEVMFGSPGETYTLSHNTIDRAAYMPGVFHVIRKVRQLNTLVYGLEKLI